MNKETIHAALRQPAPVRVKSAPTLKWASVAIVIRPNLDLLLIRRAERAGDPWSGHMAFPGGREDPEDADLVATAMRETWEEVGLDLTGATLLGRLSDNISPTREPARLAIAAFVFFIADPDPVLRLNEEASASYWMPVSCFVEEEGRSTMPFRWKGHEVTLPAVYLRDTHIWGLTLRFLDDLSARIRAVVP